MSQLSDDVFLPPRPSPSPSPKPTRALNDSFGISEEDDDTDMSYPNVSQLSDDVFLPPSPKPKTFTRTPAVKRTIEEVL